MTEIETSALATLLYVARYLVTLKNIILFNTTYRNTICLGLTSYTYATHSTAFPVRCHHTCILDTDRAFSSSASSAVCLNLLAYRSGICRLLVYQTMSNQVCAYSQNRRDLYRYRVGT
jgi:hypothetical protein